VPTARSAQAIAGGWIKLLFVHSARAGPADSHEVMRKHAKGDVSFKSRFSFVEGPLQSKTMFEGGDPRCPRASSQNWRSAEPALHFQSRFLISLNAPQAFVSGRGRLKQPGDSIAVLRRGDPSKMKAGRRCSRAGAHVEFQDFAIYRRGDAAAGDFGLTRLMAASACATRAGVSGRRRGGGRAHRG
jgi:hypothetical protein